jgi:methylglutaconyl-CoA hydratase
MQYLRTEIADHKLYITLNRPGVRNALNQPMMLELISLLKQIESDENVHVVCLRGSDQFFCAGADLNEMKASIEMTREENIKQAKTLSTLLDKLYQLNKPTVAVVEGGVYGGGLGLIACCDIAVCSEKTLFCFSEAKLGLIPAMISPYIVKAIGQRNAKRYFLTAEVFNEQKAKEINLVHEVVTEENLNDVVEKIINLLLKNSANALSKIKKLFPGVNQKKQEKLITLLADIRTSKEAQQRLSNFLQIKGDK